MRDMYFPIYLFLFMTLVAGISVARGDCNISAPREIEFQVKSCEFVDPNTQPRLIEFAERYPKGFVQSYRQEAEEEVRKVLKSYEGAILTGHGGDGTSRYFLATSNNKICKGFEKSTTVRMMIGSACCDGDPNPPCYLGFNRFITKILDAGESEQVQSENEYEGNR